MSYQLIVFDWDGTLMDSEARIVTTMQTAIGDLELEPRSRDQVKNIIGLGLKEAVAALYPQQLPSAHDALADQYRLHFLGQETESSELFEGALDVLESLSAQGYFLAVATGKGRRGLNKVLTELNVAHLFHVTRCADETRSKPHPQMLLEILDFVGLDPGQAIMVGDTEYDMELARNAGVAPVAVSYGVHERERLLSHQPLACLDDIRQLLDWLPH